MIKDLVSRCAELLAWQRTGILVDGNLRKLAESLKFKTNLPTHQSLNLAEQQTKDEALKFVTKNAPVLEELLEILDKFDCADAYEDPHTGDYTFDDKDVVAQWGFQKITVGDLRQLKSAITKLKY